MEKNKINIFIIVGILIILITSFTSAVVCCEKTKDGEYCTEADTIEDCDSTYDYDEDVNCENTGLERCTSEGICMDTENIVCNTPSQVACDDYELEWDSSYTKCSDKPNWEYGCCVINGHTDYIREIECMRDTPNEDEMEFDSSIDGNACEEIENAGDKGACVDSSGNCDYPVTREDCGDEQFFNSTDCTNESLTSYGVFCEDSGEFSCCGERTGCDLVDSEDVFKIDTCGNIMEELAEDCKKKEEICGAVDGEYTCRSLNCDVDGDGEYGGKEDMKNGESICYYDSLSAPGAEHWKKSCINGEISWDIESSGRNKICVQNTTIDPVTGEETRKAYFIPNYAEECFALTSRYNEQLNNDTKELFGSNKEKSLANGAPNDELWKLVAENRRELNNSCSDNPYCYFQSNYINSYNEDSERTKGSAFYDMGVCLPKYPKNETNCDIMKLYAPLVFYNPRDGTNRLQAVVNWGIFDDKPGNSDGNKLENLDEFFNEMNLYCTQIGDCGYSENYLGNEGDKKLSAKPDENWGPENGFKKATRKCYRRLIYPHSDPLLDVGDIRLEFCKEGEDCKIKLSKKIPEILEELEAASILGEELSEWMGMEEKNIINLFYPEGFSTEKAGSPEKNTETILNDMIENEYENEYSGFNPSEDYVEREDETYGLGKWKFVRRWQIKVKEIFDKKFLFTDCGLGNVRTVINRNGRTSTLDVEYKCQKWQPPIGGEHCEECNPENPLMEPPCTEYKCKSLGSLCEFMNVGETDEPLCIGENPDGVAPKILEIKYFGEGYGINEKEDLIWEIGEKDNPETQKCFEEGDIMKLNISLDEYSYCRYEYGPSPDVSYDGMNSISTKLQQNYTLEIEVPGINTLDESAVTGEGDETRIGKTNISLRCEDLGGASHVKQRIIKYCIKEEPDEDPPKVERFEPKEKEYPYKPIHIPLDIYFDEQIDVCKYSYSGSILPGDDFKSNPNNMSCGTNGDGEHYCSEEIEIQTKGDNTVYFICNDTFGNINSNIEYTFDIKNDISKKDWIKESGLKISSIGIEMSGKNYDNNATLSTRNTAPDITLKITTSQGLENGKSVCYRSTLKSNKNSLGNAVTKFSNTNKKTHTQKYQSLSGGQKFIKIECKDSASSDTKIINFTLDIDNEIPKIEKTYEEIEKLTIETDEPAICSYNYTNGNFDKADEGISFDETGYTINHTTLYNPSAPYHIACKDKLGNEGHIGTINEGNAQGPVITGSYYMDDNLKIITDREAKCYYGINRCPSKEEISEDNVMSSSLTKEHSVEWNSALTYYVKCEDQFGNLNRNCKSIKPLSVSN